MKDNFNQIISSEAPVLIDFYATWCGPCQTLAPVLKELKSELGEKLKLIKVDVDKNQTLASKFQIRSVPTLMLFKDGKRVWQQAGLLTKRELKDLVLAHTP